RRWSRRAAAWWTARWSRKEASHRQSNHAAAPGGGTFRQIDYGRATALDGRFAWPSRLLRSGADEVAACEQAQCGDGRHRGQREHDRRGGRVERLRGHERDMVERGEPDRPAGQRGERPDRVPQKAQADEPEGERGARARDERVEQGPEPEEEQRGGQAVRARPEQRAERHPGAGRRGARPGEQAGDERDGGGAQGGDGEPPGEPPAPPDGQREQRLQPLLGLLLTRRCDLEADEQAEGEDEEEELEADEALGLLERRAELAELRVEVARDAA